MVVEELLQKIIDNQTIQETTLKEQCKKLSVVIEELRDLEKEEMATRIEPILSEYTLSAGSQYQTNSISIGNYRKMRVYADAGFVAGATSGISVDLMYKNSIYLSDVVEVKTPNGSAGNVSIPIDVHHMESVSLLLRNRDVSNDVIIKNLKVVLYNEE